MKALIILALFICLTGGTSLTYSGNQAEYAKALEYLETKGEVFFRFPVKDRAALKDLASILSIDKVDSNNVYAYANKQEFEKFLQQGLDYEVVTHPGDLLENPKMYHGRPGESYEWDRYPTYDAYVEMMYTFEADYPELCIIEEIGESVQGRKLLVAKVSDSVNKEEAEPEFLYNTTIHGDETGGYIFMLRLIDTLLSSYSSDPHIKHLVDNIEIWIAPLCNPDGTYRSGNHTVSGARRFNANNFDLNRNFPCPCKQGTHHLYGIYDHLEPETKAILYFEKKHNFVISGDIHSGMEAAVYPWFNSRNHHPDEQWFEYVAKEYADTAQAHSPDGYFEHLGGDGIGHGWIELYEAHGTLVDSRTYFRHCRTLHLELSSQKQLPESSLNDYWEYNYRSLFKYMEQVLYGIRGTVGDVFLEPIHAKVFIKGHDDNDSSHIHSYLPYGDYYRPLYEGIYSITFSEPRIDPNYWPKTIENVTIENNKATILDVFLEPVTEIQGGNQEVNTIQISISLFGRNARISVNGIKKVNKVDIYNIMGSLIASLKPGLEESNVIWKGIDQKGRTVSNGCYLARIECYDNVITKTFLFSR